MSNQYLIQEETLQSIANSVRAKSGTTEDMAVSEIADKILEIPQEGGMAVQIQTDWIQTDESSVDYIKNKPAIYSGEGKNSIIINNEQAKAIGDNSLASGFLTLAGVKGWTIIDYIENENIIKVSDPNHTLTSLLDSSRIIYYNVRLSVSHYDMWGTIQDFERAVDNENIVLLTISNSIPESYIEEALPDRNTITFYAPFLDEEIDDNLTNEELETSVKNSLTYKLLTEGDVTIGAYTSASGYLSYAFKMMSHAEGYFTRAIGRYSHAEGRDTISGYSAHAEGYGAQALGLQSHAEGNYTLAKNYAAHAEGDQTEALGHGSHAEGMLYGGDSTKKTQAMANGSHAEGQGTVANGMGSHTEGGLTQTGGEYADITYGGGFAHAEGFETKALMARSHAEGEGTKTFGQASHAEGGNTTATGKYSHAEGNSTNAISDYTHAEGTNTSAEGEGAHAEGRTTVSNGSGAHAEGSSTQAIGHSAHTEGYGTATGTGIPADNGTTTDGFFTHAEGVGTLAKAAGSHAEGRQTSATGLYSHAEGQQTTASGLCGHAEGASTASSGECSHTEGINTNATANYTHAEGNDTKATGINSHAEGLSTISSGNGSHSEGRNTVASGNYSHAEGMINPYTYPDKTKTIEETIYNMGATGEGSHTEGINNIAAGQSSHAEGFDTAALLYYSHSEGYCTVSSGRASHAEGEGTIAKGYYAHSEGYNTQAQDTSSHAEGYGTKAEGLSSHSEGYGTIASNSASHAEGHITKAIGEHSHAEGTYTIVEGSSGHAEGYQTKVIGASSHAEGKETIASGNYSHTEGSGTQALEESSHAEGRNTLAILKGSHAEGTATVTNGHSGHTEGYGTLVGESTDTYKIADNGTATKGYFAHAEGVGTHAEGAGAHAEGRLTVASGNYSHAGGFGTKATTEAQTVIGKYNKEDSIAKFIVGVGTSDVTRANAFTAGNDGTDDYITIGEEKLTEGELKALKVGDNSAGLTRKIVTSLPMIENAKENVIYMIKDDNIEYEELGQGYFDENGFHASTESGPCYKFNNRGAGTYTFYWGISQPTLILYDANYSIIATEQAYIYDQQEQEDGTVLYYYCNTITIDNLENSIYYFSTYEPYYLEKAVYDSNKDQYKEYMLIDEEIQQIGDTSVDLSGYATKEELGDIEAALDAILAMQNGGENI